MTLSRDLIQFFLFSLRRKKASKTEEVPLAIRNIGISGSKSQSRWCIFPENKSIDNYSAEGDISSRPFIVYSYSESFKSCSSYQLFILIYIKSIWQRITITYINQSRQLRPDGVYRQECLAFLRSKYYLFNAVYQAREHFYTSLIGRNHQEPNRTDLPHSNGTDPRIPTGRLTKLDIKAVKNNVRFYVWMSTKWYSPWLRNTILHIYN